METYPPEAFTEQFRPLHGYLGDDSLHRFWIDRGRVMCGAETPVIGADVDSFVYFLGGFAKDKKHCYHLSYRLRGANADLFHALNNTYFKDDKNVWCVGGRIKDVDASTFQACDDGIYYLNGLPMPYGFGKDRLRVFYYDFNGKACWVRKADAGTFMSFNDGHFGKDEKTAFCGHSSIPKANIGSWRPIGGLYSRDARKIFYGNRAFEGADVSTFAFVETPYQAQTAMDAGNFYCNGVNIEDDLFNARMWLFSLKVAGPGLLSPRDKDRLAEKLGRLGLAADA